MQYTYKCSGCGHKKVVELPINEKPPSEIAGGPCGMPGDSAITLDCVFPCIHKRVYEFPTMINYGFREGKHGDTEKFQFHNL